MLGFEFLIIIAPQAPFLPLSDVRLWATRFEAAPLNKEEMCHTPPALQVAEFRLGSNPPLSAIFVVWLEIYEYIGHPGLNEDFDLSPFL